MSGHHEGNDLRTMNLGNDRSELNSNNDTELTEILNRNAQAQDLEKRFRNLPLTGDTTCGIWIFRGKFFQRFANQFVFFLLYGIVGILYSMTSAYFNATYSTFEKRFDIPPINAAFIRNANNISEALLAAILGYYAGKGHRPKWISLGSLLLVIYCFICTTPHLFYGAGNNSLNLTSEYGASHTQTETKTEEFLVKKTGDYFCGHEDLFRCRSYQGSLIPQVLLLIAKLLSGVSGALYYAAGVSYMDDNIDKGKMPAFWSIATFIHMQGPALGFYLASYCLSIYISPGLHPVINDKDPRWLGAWWLGWILLGALFLFSALLVSMLPKELPRTRKRHLIQRELMHDKELHNEECECASFKDMTETFKRLCKNKTLVFNLFSSVFFFFGFVPYLIFTSKYMLIQFKYKYWNEGERFSPDWQLGATPIAVLLSGLILSKFQPRARYLAAWNVIVGFLIVIGLTAYAFIDCFPHDQPVVYNNYNPGRDGFLCDNSCKCEFAPLSPVCGENDITYISPCHAGCTQTDGDAYVNRYYYNCSCIPGIVKGQVDLKIFKNIPGVKDMQSPDDEERLGRATSGFCEVNCHKELFIFLLILMGIKFLGTTGRVSNFLITLRSVQEKDKTAVIGLGITLVCLLSFIPSPLFFGWLVNRSCKVWGKSCTSEQNCWEYDQTYLRMALNFTAAGFILIGAFLDVAVWFNAKNLKIFDTKVKARE